MTFNAYAECFYLSVTIKSIILNVNMLSVVMLNVVASGAPCSDEVKSV